MRRKAGMKEFLVVVFLMAGLAASDYHFYPDTHISGLVFIGYIYTADVSTLMTYDEAVKKCESLNGEVAFHNMETEEKRERIYGQLSPAPYWLGVQYQRNKGRRSKKRWRYMDKTPVRTKRFGWAPGQPSLAQGNCTINYQTMSLVESTDCNQPKAFPLCQVRQSYSDEFVNHMPEISTFVHKGYQYFRPSFSGSTYSEARELCQSLGGSIAHHNMETMEDRNAILEGMSGLYSYWIGVTNDGGQWAYHDGRPVDSDNFGWDLDMMTPGQKCSATEVVPLMRSYECDSEEPVALCEKVSVSTPPPIKEKLIILDNPAVVNDPVWSEWTSYSPCSTTCGPGTMTRTRTCMNSTPGNDCEGPTEETLECNLKECINCDNLKDSLKTGCHFFVHIGNQCGTKYIETVCSKSCCDKKKAQEEPSMFEFSRMMIWDCEDKEGVKCSFYKNLCFNRMVQEDCPKTCKQC